MATITQDIHFRLSLIRYAEKHGVTRKRYSGHTIQGNIIQSRNILLMNAINQ